MTRSALLSAPLVLAALLSPAMAQDQAAIQAGEALYKARCTACHSLEPGQNRAGPSLGGIVGRKAGTVEGARYSRTLPASDITWNEQTLDAYLANPRQTVAGTTMVINVPNAEQRRSIVAYLVSLSAPR